MRGAFTYAGYRVVHRSGRYRAEAIGEEDDLLILECFHLEPIIEAIDTIEEIDYDKPETMPSWFRSWMSGSSSGPVFLTSPLEISIAIETAEAQSQRGTRRKISAS